MQRRLSRDAGIFKARAAATSATRRTGRRGAATLVLLTALIALALWPRSARPITGPAPVAEILTPRINGQTQQVLVRGRSRHDPLLLYLNGGPGIPEGMLNQILAPAWEDHFLTVQWDQRGSGRSYALLSPPDDLSIDTHIADLHALVRWLKRRYGHRQVILVGHSWGSILGVLYASRYPKDVAAYVGLGQVVDMADGERRSFAFTLAEARRRGDTAAERELASMGAPPFDFATTVRQRRYVEAYGGAFRRPIDPIRTAARVLALPEYELQDVWRFFDGARRSGRTMWPEILTVDLERTAPRLDVPVYFILGRHDQMAPSALAARYATRLKSPRVQWWWVEEAAHNPHWEQPTIVLNLLKAVKRDIGAQSTSVR